MKKLYFKAFIFLILFIIVLGIFDIVSMSDRYRQFIAELTNSSEYLTKNEGSAEIISRLESVKKDDGKNKLILGDSVCFQMFSGLQEYNDDILIQGSNSAITMSGQYIMAKEYLEAHPGATDIYMIVLPLSLKSSYKTTWGYQYAVMPFVETDTIKYLEPDTIDIMNKTYGELFLKPKIVWAIDRSGLNRKLYLNGIRDITVGYVPDDPYEIANIYLNKIRKMCNDRGVNFYLYPGPVSEEKRDKTEELGQTFSQSEIYDINPDFFNRIYYYDAEQSADGSHFRKAYANQEMFNEKIKVMLEGTELIEVLNFE